MAGARARPTAPRSPPTSCIVGIGIAPDDALAARRGARRSRTASWSTRRAAPRDPAIFAAGDCAQLPLRRRADSGSRACPTPSTRPRRSPRRCSAAPSPIVARPWFWSDQYDVKLQIAGLNTGYDRTLTRPGPRPGSQSVWYCQGPRLIAVDAMNDAARLHDRQALDRGRRLARPRARRRRRHRPQGARLMRSSPAGCAAPASPRSAPATRRAQLRPTADRVRESLFNLLAHGALRRPAAARGAPRARPLRRHRGARARGAVARRGRGGLRRDRRRPALALMRGNIAELRAEAARGCWRATRPGCGPNAGAAFDLVFLDPPYGQGLGERALAAALGRAAGSRPGALVVWEEGGAPAPPPGLTLLDRAPLWRHDDLDPARGRPHDRRPRRLLAEVFGYSRLPPRPGGDRAPRSRPGATCSRSCRPAAASRSVPAAGALPRRA